MFFFFSQEMLQVQKKKNSGEMILGTDSIFSYHMQGVNHTTIKYPSNGT